MTPSDFRLARRAATLTPSAVREILKVAERPDILSFAGGLPAPELFPVDDIAKAYARVFEDEGPAALQYGVTEGFLPLREWIAKDLLRRGIASSPDQLLVVSGSQQGIDLTARVLLNPGDTVLVENPTYLAALQTFAAYEVNVVPVESDEDGMLPDALQSALSQHSARLIYVIPEFQNPRGTSWSGERRMLLAELAERHAVPILEDDPYGALRFEGVAKQPIAALTERALYLGTFSKTLAPGLRIGWVHGPAPLLRKLTIAKQACDLQTATLAQRAAAKLLQTFDYDAHVARLRKVYGERGAAMQAALTRHLPKQARWTHPEGGLFVWVRLPEGVDDETLFKSALRRKVAAVPGAGFFVGGADHRHLRLNFSNQPLEKIEVGMQRLGEAIAEELHRARPLSA